MTETTLSTIWIVEDHDRLRQTLGEAMTLAGATTVRLFASCEAALAAFPGPGSSGLSGLSGLSGSSPQVIILDIGLPGMSGIDGIARFKVLAPACHIIMFSVFDDLARVFNAICAGASGYLLKSETLERIVGAVQEVLHGGAPMSPEIARSVLDRFSRLRPSTGAVELSERERDVLRLLADGLTKKEISTKLDLSLHTVDNYVRRIYAKLHVNTLGGAVAKALREGLV